MRHGKARVMAILAAGLLTPAVSLATSPEGGAAANRDAAALQAAHLLGLIQLPSGTTPLAAEPGDDRGALRLPTYDEATPNLVDAPAWWSTPASAQAVRSYVSTHLPPGAAQSGSGSGQSGSGQQVVTASEIFALPPVAGVLSERVIGVTTVTLPDGRTEVRTDGEAVWLTPRPPWEQIPVTVRRVVFTARGADAGGRLGRPSAPRTVRGGAARRLVAAINGAEVVQPGVRSCPDAFADSVTLSFRDARDRTLARAIEYPSGCASITLRIAARTGPALQDSPGVTDELLRVGAVPVCPGRSLSASVSPPGRDGPVNARAISFSFRNGSDVMCRLGGFPRLRVFDASGHPIGISVTRQDAGGVRSEGLGATSVLDPGQSAGFYATYRVCRGAARSELARVSLPGVNRLFTLAIGTAARPFAPCRGAVSVGNL